MSLIGPDQGMTLIEGVALLLVSPDNFFEHFHVQCIAFRLIDAVNQFPDIRPAMLIKGNPDRFRLMAQDQRNESACTI
jgi:hypothetical protein